MKTSKRPHPTSLLQILAQPELHDGKEVQVIGFLNLEFEGNALYLHQEDHRYSLGNSIWVETNEKVVKDQVNQKYAIIRGTYFAKERGHMGMFTGTLKNITRCDPWSNPEKPRSSR